MPRPDFAASTISSEEFASLRAVRPARSRRVSRPHSPLVLADRWWPGNGRLFIVAADHPARGALSVGKDRMAMASRYELLQRLVLALSAARS